MKYRRKILVLIGLALLLFSCQENGASPPVESDDLGGWQLLGLEQEEILVIALDPIDENIIYAGGFCCNLPAGKEGGLFKSSDGGAVWDTLIRGITVMDFKIHPSNSEILYVAIADPIGYTPPGIIKTTDGGITWARADDGISFNWELWPWCLAIDPLHPDTIFVGTGGFFGGWLYKSTNGGQTWQGVSNVEESPLLGGGITALAINPKNTDTVFAGTAWNTALLKTPDGGETWIQLDFPDKEKQIPGFIKDILIHPAHPDTVYVGTGKGGFFISTDGGTSWQSANVGLPGDTVWVSEIEISPEGQIYIATKAVYKSAQDNINWTVVGKHIPDLWAESIGYSPLLDKLYMGSSKGIYSFDLAE